MKAPKIVALDEKPTIELTVDFVQIFGMKVDWEQVLEDVFTALTARIQVVNPDVTILVRYGKRVVKNEDTERTTGFRTSCGSLSDTRRRTRLVSPGDHQWTDVRTDSQNSEARVISRQSACSILFDNCDYHENVSVFPDDQESPDGKYPDYPGRGKEANTQN